MARIALCLELVVALGVVGCGGVGGDPCQQAADHLASCGVAAPDSFAASCQDSGSERADTITQASCDQLSAFAGDAKADGSGWSLGILGRGNGDGCTLSLQCRDDLVCRPFINGDYCAPRIKEGGHCLMGYLSNPCATGLKCKADGSLESALLDIGSCL